MTRKLSSSFTDTAQNSMRLQEGRPSLRGTSNFRACRSFIAGPQAETCFTQGMSPQPCGAVPHLKAFLQLVTQRSGTKTIHIVAHSLGNRALMYALQQISQDQSSTAKFHQIVLAAPDIDVNVFSANSHLHFLRLRIMSRSMLHLTTGLSRYPSSFTNHRQWAGSLNSLVVSGRALTSLMHRSRAMIFSLSIIATMQATWPCWRIWRT